MWLSNQPVVAHFVQRYFELSENWIHTQIKHLERWAPFVVANATANLDALAWKPPYFARWEHLRGPLRRLDDRLYRRYRYAPSHYLALYWSKARIIHAHFGPKGVEAMPLARARGLPLITSFYGYDLSKLPLEDPQWVPRYQRLFAEGARFLVEGPHMAEQLADLGCPRSKIVIQHIGIETQNYPFLARPHSVEKGLRILMIGRFVEKKGFPDGIEAFASFLREGGRGQLTIVGDDSRYEPTANYRDKLEALVAELGIGAHVEFLGFVPHDALKRLLYRHHLLLSPSRTATSGDNEGGAPVTLLEAQATGMPVISTLHCDIPEVVDDETTGLLAPEGDVATLTAHLLELYHKPEHAAAMGRAAHEWVQHRHDARRQGRTLDALYDTVLEERQHNPEPETRTLEPVA